MQFLYVQQVIEEVNTSIGVINEGSINQLALVCHLCKNIALRSDSESNEYELSQISPKFLWILRDFMLEPRDVRGKLTDIPHYLESALTDIAHVKITKIN